MLDLQFQPYFIAEDSTVDIAKSIVTLMETFIATKACASRSTNQHFIKLQYIPRKHPQVGPRINISLIYSTTECHDTTCRFLMPMVLQPYFSFSCEKNRYYAICERPVEPFVGVTAVFLGVSSSHHPIGDSERQLRLGDNFQRTTPLRWSPYSSSPSWLGRLVGDWGQPSHVAHVLHATRPEQFGDCSHSTQKQGISPSNHST